MSFIQSRGRRAALFFVLFAAALVLTACGTSKNVRPGQTGENNGSEQGGEALNNSNVDVRGLAGIPKGDRSMFTDPDNPLSTRTIYFAFDSSAIPSRFEPVIKAHAQYLAKHSKVHLRLEGNTDERGTREYNVALGERRAESVKQALVISGAKPGQITTLSFGEERPAVPGHSKQAYAKNRRVEFVYVE